MQARCRGYLVRREFHQKMWAVTKIQAHVRGLIARRQYRKLKMRVEAARLKEEEEKALRQQMDKRKAREIAEMKYLVSFYHYFLYAHCIQSLDRELDFPFVAENAYATFRNTIILAAQHLKHLYCTCRSG